jgi:chloride channel protein, CIC family
VQIGSALASSIGQWVRMPENRLRIMVACGAAGGISATFNAPITGVFFGVEIILREFAVDALFTVMLSAMVADVVAIPFLGDKPFLSGFPAGLMLHHPRNYLFIAGLAVVAALMGLAFKSALYKIEDLCDTLWKGRPEWARPAVGGVALGLLLLALPQLYGVGYPVMYQATAGGYALWFLVVLAFGKILATSLSIGIGGSGGIFAPSLFIGVTSGYAYGDIVNHLFGASAGPPALYAVVAMGAVFASAARAPLTSLASVVEMSGDFALTLPVMLAVAIASTVSRALSYGTIYTTKLLRRGIDIDRAAPWRAVGDLKVTDVMRPFRPALPVPPGAAHATMESTASRDDAAGKDGMALAELITYRHDVQVLFASESLGQALRQLAVYGRDGLPVVSPDSRALEGWVTSAGVMRALAHRVAGTATEATYAQAAADPEHDDVQAMLEHPSVPLPGYRVAELVITPDSPAAGRKLSDVDWPTASVPVSLLRDGLLRPPRRDETLTTGDRVSLLIPASQDAAPGDAKPSRAELPGREPGIAKERAN